MPWLLSLVHLEGAERTAVHGLGYVLRARYRRKAETRRVLPHQHGSYPLAALRSLVCAPRYPGGGQWYEGRVIGGTAWMPVCLGRFRRVMSAESKTGTGFSPRR
jgi:hypothetical protein